MYELFDIAERFGWTERELFNLIVDFISANGDLDELQEGLIALGERAQPDA